MKQLTTVTFLGLLLCIGVHGQTFDSGSRGEDGEFNPPGQVPPDIRADVVVQGDCTRAPGCTVIVPLREPPRHVFKFTTVTIGPNVTVKFRRNAANTPVFILARGDVVINGTIDVSGQNGARGTVAAQGGPGGFAGGVGVPPGGATNQGGAGSGPGGGGGGIEGGDIRRHGSGGGFGGGGAGPQSGAVYGMPELLPLIGGSGGGGGATDRSVPGSNGGGGGGALLIASSGIIDVGSGTGNACIARGGGGDISVREGGGGSGGAIRLVAPTIRGGRGIFAGGGGPGYHPGGGGRIRLEAFSLQMYTGSTDPQYTLGQPGPVFPPITPTVRVISIGGVRLPDQRTVAVTTPDVTVPVNFTNPVTIELEARNVPSGAQARVTLAPQLGAGARVISPPVPLTGLAGQPKRGTVTVNLPTRGVGIVSAVIDSVTPERPMSNTNQ